MESLEAQADKAAARRRYAEATLLLREVVASEPGNFDGWLKLASMSRASGDLDAAIDALRRALSLRPLDFVALMMKATVLYAMGRPDEAGETYGQALAQTPAPIPASMLSAVATARERFGNWQNFRARAIRAAVSRLTPLTPSLDRLITNTIRLTDPDRAGPTHYCYPGLPEIPFLPREQFPWLSELEAATDDIQREFETVLTAEAAELVPYISYASDIPARQWEELNNSRDWTAIHLVKNGEVVVANARHCPSTMALLQAIPQPKVPGAGPNAMFSLLAPGSHIPPHTGVANTRLVCHLPLIVPPKCWFRVGDDRRDWERAKAWVFDDTIVHEAMNPTDALRVILIVDIWHPALTVSEQIGVAAVIEALGMAPDQLGQDDRLWGYRALTNRDYPGAVKAYRRVVARNPEDYESWNNLANALSSLGQVDQAIEAFESAIALRPDLPDLYTNFSKALVPHGRDEERQRIMQIAGAIAPHDAKVQLELGLAESAAKNYLASEVAYRAAIRLTEGFTPAHLELGLLLENLNRLESLGQLIQDAEAKGINCSEIDFLKAWLLRRRGRFQEALPLAKAAPESVSPVRRAQLIAEISDRLGDVDQAFEAFSAMNIAAAEAFPNEAAEQGYREEVAGIGNLLTRDKISRWSVANVKNFPPPPVFIVGFPRSGTTLLDTLLMNIPNFHVLEELPVVRQVEYALGDSVRIASISTEEADMLRDRYFDALQIISPADPDKTIIDKYPLHMARIPLIHRIFPDAKIIFVERHPFDVVLSCFMANFQLNRAMRYFGTLEDAAKLYDTVFETWTRSRELLPLKIHNVRYECMVNDLEGEMRSLLDFLEVGWDRAVLDNKGAAKRRTHIRTASYSQVTEEIYGRASGRWRRYRDKMEFVLPILTPWAKKMGYEV